MRWLLVFLCALIVAGHMAFLLAMALVVVDYSVEPGSPRFAAAWFLVIVGTVWAWHWLARLIFLLKEVRRESP